MPLGHKYLLKVANESKIKVEGTRHVFTQVHHTIDEILIRLWGEVLSFEGNQFKFNIPINIEATIEEVKRKYPNPELEEYLRCDTIELFVDFTKKIYESCGWVSVEIKQNEDSTYQFTFCKQH